MIRYLLAIGRRGPRRFFDRVAMRVVQLEQSREQVRRVRVVRLRERQG